MQDEEILMEALKQVDVVICAVASKQVLDQKLLIPAIKRAGCIKVFILLFCFPIFLVLQFYECTNIHNTDVWT